MITIKVVADVAAVEKINVVNTTSQKATITDKDGVFNIQVKIGDVLVLSAINLETRRKTIASEDLKSENLIVKMNLKINQLKEVKVNENSDINAESLGIIPHGQKQYTPAERKYATAASGKMNPMGIDPLINLISGRSAMLKKEVAVERNERLLIKLDGLYEQKYYIQVLKIPEDYIKGFQYYLIDDKEFVNAIQAKNKTLTMFLAKNLALNYLKTLN